MDMVLGNKPAAGAVKEATTATFEQDVMAASMQGPVIVDFWAPWCGPCKQLTPVLERVVGASGGRVKLVKVDVDKSRALVEQLTRIGIPMQSIPTVVAFWQGQPADLFQGVLPESEVKRFVEQVLKLAGGVMPAAEMLAEAQAALADGQAEEAGRCSVR